MTINNSEFMRTIYCKYIMPVNTSRWLSHQSQVKQKIQNRILYCAILTVIITAANWKKVGLGNYYIRLRSDCSELFFSV